MTPRIQLCEPEPSYTVQIARYRRKHALRRLAVGLTLWIVFASVIIGIVKYLGIP